MGRPLDKSTADRIEAENKDLPEKLAKIDPAAWNDREAFLRVGTIERWISRYYDVNIFKHIDGTERIMVNRRSVDIEKGMWRDGIAWDELQEIKRQCGRGNKLAVEVFPEDDNIVNNGNYRHLWIVDKNKISQDVLSNFVWTNKRNSLSVFDDWTPGSILNSSPWSI